MEVNKELVEVMSETISARKLSEMLLRSMQREERLKDDVTIYINTIIELREQLNQEHGPTIAEEDVIRDIGSIV